MIKRRDCEYELFQSIENAFELRRIQQGFNSVYDFIVHSQTVLQRRKARAGRSFELHVRQIFLEEGLIEGLHFSYQPESDPGKKPDFLFPSEASYKNPLFPRNRLCLLAVKTTCKDRWRQVLNEAKEIDVKHILTLQEGVSQRQFQEMRDAKVKLVVPEPLKADYPAAIRNDLLSVESFIADVRLLALP